MEHSEDSNLPAGDETVLEKIERMKNEKPQFSCMGFGCLGTTVLAVLAYLIIHFLRK